MTMQTKTIGRMPTDHGPYDPQLAYGKKFQCTLFGCAWESLHDNNNTAPAVWDGGDTITPNPVDWKKVSGDYDAWLMNQDKPAKSEQYPFNGMGRVKLAKNIVNGVNTLTQAMLTQQNTIYVIQYDFTLGEDITVPADCILEFNRGSISGEYTLTGQNSGIKAGLVKIFNTNITLAGSWNVAESYTEWFGAKGDGVSDDTNSFVACASAINNTIGLQILSFKAKKYILSAEINITKDIVIEGNGSELYFASIGSSYYGLQIARESDDNYIHLTTCSGIAMNKGSKRISCSTVDTSLKVGNYIILYDNAPGSFSTAKEIYHKGDLFKIYAIGDGYIDVTDDSTDSYGDTIIEGITYNCAIYKVDTISAIVRNLIITREPDSTLSTCLRIKGGVDSLVDNIISYGAQNTHIGLDYCYNVSITNCKVDYNCLVDTYGYGLTISTSKNIIVSENYFKTKRHGITTGGRYLCIPNRYIQIVDNIIDNYIIKNSSTDTQNNETSVACILTHANAEFITITDNIIKQGVSLTAKNSILSNNLIYSGDRYNTAVYLGASGVNCEVKNNKIQYVGDAHFEKDGTSIANAVFIISNLLCDFDSLSIFGNEINVIGGNASIIQMFEFTSSSLYTIKNFNIANNYFNSSPVECQFLRASNNGTVDVVTVSNNQIINCFLWFRGDTLTINGIVCKNNNIFPPEGRTAITIRNLTTNSSNKTFVVDGNIINKPSSIGVYILSADGIVITNNIYLYPTATNYENTFISINGGSNVVVTGNVSKEGYSGTNLFAIDLQGNNSKLIIKDNKYYYNNTLSVRYSGTTTNSDVIVVDKGPSTNRPDIITTAGTQYFDTTLGKPIYWNGTAWVDATGTPV